MDRHKIFMEAAEAFIERHESSNLIAEDFHPLVTNLAYLEVERAKRNGSPIPLDKSFSILSEYDRIASSQINNFNYEIHKVMPGYMLTLEWDGLWIFLVDYFSKNLGWEIDQNLNIDATRFDSSQHERHEFGELVSSSEIERKIDFIFSNNHNDLVVKISETLSDKKARLIKEQGNTKIYRGTDPDYLFTIYFDSFGSVEKFVLDLIPRSLRITYYE